jgi:hypothetical protein
MCKTLGGYVGKMLVLCGFSFLKRTSGRGFNTFHRVGDFSSASLSLIFQAQF